MVYCALKDSCNLPDMTKAQFLHGAEQYMIIFLKDHFVLTRESSWSMSHIQVLYGFKLAELQ